MVEKKEEKVGNGVQQPPRQTGNSVQEKFQEAVHAAKMRLMNQLISLYGNSLVLR